MTPEQLARKMKAKKLSRIRDFVALGLFLVIVLCFTFHFTTDSGMIFGYIGFIAIVVEMFVTNILLLMIPKEFRKSKA